MKIALHEFFPSLKQKTYGVFLLYGNKLDLIESILNELQNVELRFIRAQDSEFWNQHIELCTPTLFNMGRTVLLIQEVPEKKFSSYQPIVEALPKNLQIIFTSSQFRQNSSWLRSFQQSTTKAVIPCYEISLNQSMAILKRCLEEYQVPLSEHHLKMVSQWVQEGDWLSTAKTLQLLYQAKNKNSIQQEDLEKIFNHLAVNSEEIFLPFMNKPDLSIVEHLRHSDEKLRWVRIWQKLSFQCWQLKVTLKHYTKTQQNSQKKILPHEVAKLATQLDPPIFFKYIPFIQKYIHEWSLEFLEKRMDDLYDLEVNIKKEIFQKNDDISIVQMLCL
ncbi:DNA polymerase III subunit delta [Holospora obtusa F1]|uniref:DNA polymerase III subunit delta n=1 Tax=Holospora obtusa F1 TaxID=1399147 RepID=W6TSG7_HOLOB|nr:hypothetical protein [Holospora obtusa]ETZ06762.1 DNA polymerase III subunit delta [Holospora obtusa F1]